ncbi:Aste57867_8640 [Aphanomyces stellatus]|uniref:Aste57867_8640 protein n=1 Tax=Aphanomyces stellatus TaxID=120398 RepID=A0A485KKU8_9STRA|nr:hypothetical protein As57867_008606 [Aphanomyces stellatus]VFT85526.1 Aste57867_8640 [Aphanomyces stellatus]
MPTDGELDLDLLERYDKKLQRRIYLRNMKRVYRNEEAQVRLYLSQQAQQLEVVLAPILQRQKGRQAKGETSTSLAWKEIADALNGEVSLSKSQQKALKVQVRDYAQLLHDMAKWVDMHSTLQSTMGHDVATWRDCTLLSTPQSRQLGKEWIAKRMFYNTDSMFQGNGFAAIDSDDRMDLDLRFTFEESGYSAVYRDQFEVSGSFDELVVYMRLIVLGIGCFIPQYSPDIPLILHEVDGNISQQAFLTPTNEQVNALVAEYRTENRCIMVFRQIQDDEAWVSDTGHHIRNRTGWFDAHRLANGKVRFRALSFHYQPYTRNAGCLPLDQDAIAYGIDLGDCPTQAVKEARFEHFIRIGVISAVQAHQENEMPFELVL